MKNEQLRHDDNPQAQREVAKNIIQNCQTPNIRVKHSSACGYMFIWLVGQLVASTSNFRNQRVQCNSFYDALNHLKRTKIGMLKTIS